MEERSEERPERREAALRALERHRARAAEQGHGVACLIERAEGTAEEPLHRRRAEVVRWATEELGLPEPLAGLVYDLAREEGVEPALAVELVHCGVGVLESPTEEELQEETPATEPGRPDWIETPLPPDEARRERRMRVSFRRLRTLLEQHEDPADALVAFAREPDVGESGY